MCGDAHGKALEHVDAAGELKPQSLGIDGAVAVSQSVSQCREAG